jgi:hypothetical protein
MQIIQEFIKIWQNNNVIDFVEFNHCRVKEGMGRCVGLGLREKKKRE